MDRMQVGEGQLERTHVRESLLVRDSDDARRGRGAELRACDADGHSSFCSGEAGGDGSVRALGFGIHGSFFALHCISRRPVYIPFLFPSRRISQLRSPPMC